MFKDFHGFRFGGVSQAHCLKGVGLGFCLLEALVHEPSGV